MKGIWKTLVLSTAFAAIGCGDGCGCGAEPQAPVVPESAGGTDDFDPTTGSSAPQRSQPAPGPSIEVAPVQAAVEEPVLEPPVEGEPTVDPTLPHQPDPNAHIRAVQPPAVQVRPIAPGVDTRLPSHLSPRVVTPQIRYEGPGASLPAPAGDE